jgi:hypothetical protein
MAKVSNKLIIILGMHRSGTSVVARGLQVLGVCLGENLMAVQPDNPKGFWEDLDINAFNIEMLNALEGEWHDLRPITERDVETLKAGGFLERGVGLLKDKISGVDAFGIKDPRMARLFPFWKEVLRKSGCDVYYILTLRHPVSVAWSLARRDGFEPAKSYLLWFVHVLTSIAGTQGEKRILVDYDILMSAPRAELERIAGFLDLPLDAEEFERYRADFLDESLNHGSNKLRELPGGEGEPKIVQDVFESLLEVALGNGDIDGLFQERGRIWFQRLEDMQAALGLADTYCKEVRKVRIQNEELQKELMLMNKKILEHENQLDAIMNSLSWRMTAPLRRISKALRSS